MPHIRDSKAFRATLDFAAYFVAGLAGTACLLLLASSSIRCVLEYGVLDLSVALVLVLLSGLAAVLVVLLPDRIRRLAVSVYSGVVMALVGFILLIWVLPSPPVERCSVLVSSAGAAEPTPKGDTIPTPMTFHSVVLAPASTSPAKGEGTAPCVPPVGWVIHYVRHGDTLYSLAQRTSTSVQQLMAENCMTSSVLHMGQIIRLPMRLVGEEHPAGTMCNPPPSWVSYYVRPGDTLSRLAVETGTKVPHLMKTNCLEATTLFVGTKLWLPRLPSLPTQTPEPTQTPSG